MPPQYRRFATLQPFLQQVDPAGGGGNPPTPPSNDPPKPDDEPLGEAGKKALDDERTARREAERKARDAEKELADLKSAATKREEAEQAEQGRWKELAEKRDADLTATTTERDSLKATNDALTAYFDGHYTAALKDLPEVIKAFAPAEDAPFATKADWLTKAQAQAAKIAQDEAKPGNGPGPKPAGNTKPDVRGVLPRRKLIN